MPPSLDPSCPAHGCIRPGMTKPGGSARRVSNSLKKVSDLTGGIPENSIRADTRDEAESAHHVARYLHSFSCLGLLSPTCSSRGVGRGEAISHCRRGRG